MDFLDADDDFLKSLPILSDWRAETALPSLHTSCPYPPMARSAGPWQSSASDTLEHYPSPWTLSAPSTSHQGGFPSADSNPAGTWQPLAFNGGSWQDAAPGPSRPDLVIRPASQPQVDLWRLQEQDCCCPSQQQQQYQQQQLPFQQPPPLLQPPKQQPFQPTQQQHHQLSQQLQQPQHQYPSQQPQQQQQPFQRISQTPQHQVFQQQLPLPPQQQPPLAQQQQQQQPSQQPQHEQNLQLPIRRLTPPQHQFEWHLHLRPEPQSQQRPASSYSGVCGHAAAAAATSAAEPWPWAQQLHHLSYPGPSHVDQGAQRQQPPSCPAGPLVDATSQPPPSIFSTGAALGGLLRERSRGQLDDSNVTANSAPGFLGSRASGSTAEMLLAEIEAAPWPSSQLSHRAAAAAYEAAAALEKSRLPLSTGGGGTGRGQTCDGSYTDRGAVHPVSHLLPSLSDHCRLNIPQLRVMGPSPPLEQVCVYPRAASATAAELTATQQLPAHHDAGTDLRSAITDAFWQPAAYDPGQLPRQLSTGASAATAPPPPPPPPSSEDLGIADTPMDSAGYMAEAASPAEVSALSPQLQPEAAAVARAPLPGSGGEAAASFGKTARARESLSSRQDEIAEEADEGDGSGDADADEDEGMAAATPHRASGGAAAAITAGAIGGRVGRTCNRITLEELRAMFDLPVQEVVRILGISATDLKRRCRTLNIQRWPQRKLMSLRRLAEALETDKEISEEERKEVLERIARNRARILEDPDAELEPCLLPLRQAHYKRNFVDRRNAAKW